MPTVHWHARWIILELCSLNGSGYTLTQLSQHLGIA